MSVQTTKSTDETTIEQHHFRLPATAPAQIEWLDEQPNSIEVEHEKEIKPFNVERGRRETYVRNPDVRMVTEQFFLHPDYEVTGRACHGSQAEVCDAFEDMMFPAHNLATIEGLTGAHSYTWSTSGTNPASRGMFRRGRRNNTDSNSTINYEAVQAPDGRGVIRHYSTIAAVRTRTGLVLTSEQDWGTGFARMTQPDGDYHLPLTGVNNVLSGHPETLYDIVDVTVADPGDHDYWSDRIALRRSTTRLDLASGAAVIVLYDSTANDPDERKCGFYLDPEEAATYEGIEGALDALRPIDVKQALDRGVEMVPANEYAENGAHGFYDDSLLGDVIIRQGEWYLIPMDEGWMPNAPVYKPLPQPRRESDWETDHVDLPEGCSMTDYNAVTDGLPEACPLCENDGLVLKGRLPIAECLACDFSVCYDEDEAEKLAAEALMGYIESAFSDLYDDALDTLDSHRPRDLAVTDDGIFVRGSFRHLRNEHKMTNLNDRWHLAVENTRDVTVFDLGADTSGVARYE